jgi:hypothetical protein
MSYVKWTFRLLILAIVGAYLHYTLPRHDVVRIVGSEVRLQDVDGWDSIFWNSAEQRNPNNTSRDVKFISTIEERGRPLVFRNEDTGWGWPPYFKFNSADLQAKAADLQATDTTPVWTLVKYYGWRNQFITIYPNVLDMTRVDGPDHRVIPWFNIVFFTGLIALVLFLRATWRRFRKKRIDPIVRDVAGAFEPEERGGLTGKPFRGTRERFREWWVEHFG